MMPGVASEEFLFFPQLSANLKNYIGILRSFPQFPPNFRTIPKQLCYTRLGFVSDDGPTA